MWNLVLIFIFLVALLLELKLLYLWNSQAYESQNRTLSEFSENSRQVQIIVQPAGA